MIITIDYQEIKVPDEIIRFCDFFTYNADREDLRYLDCIYMNMGLYGNDKEQLRRFRESYNYPKVMPIF